MKNAIAILLLCASQAFPATRYVDSNSPGGNDGLSWATAWDHPSQVSAAPGDTVYISGGTTSKTYTITSAWDPPNGTSGNPVTISNGRDTGHTGQVVFNVSGASTALTGLQWVTFDFYFGGTQKLRFSGDPTTGMTIFDDGSSTGFKLLGAILNWRIRMYDSRKTEIAYCIINNESRKLTGGPGWIIGVGRNDGTGFGNNSIHHNIFNLFYLRVPDANGENGDDGLQNCSGSLDFYNNTMISVVTTGFAGDNHQDGAQSDGRYMRFYNNYFENLANYMIFGEYFTTQTATFWYIYNNVFNYSDPVLNANPTQAIAIGNGKTGPTTPLVFSDIYVFNNTFQGGNQALALGTPGQNNSFVNCRIQNNLRFNSGGLNVNGPGATISNNAAAGSNWFVNAAGGDFRLTSNATGAIGQGTTSGGVFSAITSTDRAGVTRGATWDIGAYEFEAAVGPGSVAFNAVPIAVAEGAGTLAVTVNRVNGTTGAIGVSYATSNGSATSGSDYTAASGTLSWADGDGAAKTVNVSITQDGTVEGNEDFTFTLSSPTGGASIVGVTANTVTIVDDEAPVIPLMSGLTFTAELGLVEAPFTATGTAISQAVDTGPTDGGRVRYRVTIPTTGDYSITMNMNCASTGSDSIYVTWDGEPAEPANVFDVGVTSGFETKTVSWRGTGGPATPEFSPKFWNLTAGVHELTIRGREPGAQFNSITVVPAAVTDTTAPTPNPPEWELDPIAPVGNDGQSRINMTVAVVSDPSGPVEYYFDETSGGPGGTDSGWQEGVGYQDEGLTPSTTYTYRVKARDAVGNETSWSDVGPGTTNAILSGSTTINATNLIISP